MAVVSIILPCYNAEGYIVRCLTSLAAQTFRDFDVILVDDCSTDGTAALAEKTAEQLGLRARILKNAQNLGPSLSRNRGVEQSSAAYVAFCDCDDTYESGYVEQMLLASNRLTNDIVFCNYNAVYSNGARVKHNVTSSMASLTKKELIAKGVDALWAMMVKRSIISNLEFPDIRNGEDMAVIPILIAEADSFGFVPEYIYNYNYRENSLSRQSNEAMIPSLRQSFEYICENLSNEYLEETEFLGVRNYIYAALLSHFKISSGRAQAKNIMEGFEQNYPNWRDNRYIKSLPIHRKIFLFCAGRKLYFLCRCMSMLHRKISK